MKICLILLMIALSGCTVQARKPVAKPMSMATKQAIYDMIIDMKPDDVIYKVYKVRQDDGTYRITKIIKEPDPFRRGQLQ